MNPKKWLSTAIGKVRKIPISLPTAVAVGMTVTACAELATSLMTAVTAGYGQPLVATANQNYNQNFSGALSNLLVAMAYDKLKLNDNNAAAFYPYAGNSNPGAYTDPYQNQPGYSDPYQSQPGYSDPYQNQQANDPYQSQPGYNDPYQNQQGNDPYQSQPGYNDPYQNQQGNDPYQSQPDYNDPYQNQQGNDPYQNQQASNPYPNQPGYNDPYQSRGGDPQTINMNVALLTQQSKPDGTYALMPIQDGAVLRDGGGNPAAGDKLKVFFSVNCACYIYVIGIDATGFVAQIFPDTESGAVNPARPGQQYLLPEGVDWWGLDEYKGVEQIYFVASFSQRIDLEEIVAALVNQPRTRGGVYEPVTEAAIVPVPRGLIKTQVAPPTMVPTSYGQPYEVTPQAFSTTAAGADLVITRWFRHE